MRRAASWIQPLQVRSGPRGARRTRRPVVGTVATDMSNPPIAVGGGGLPIIIPPGPQKPGFLEKPGFYPAACAEPFIDSRSGRPHDRGANAATALARTPPCRA